jgi:hypothetical protein
MHGEFGVANRAEEVVAVRLLLNRWRVWRIDLVMESV